MNDAAPDSPITSSSELDLRLVIEKARSFPRNRPIIRRQRPNILRQQINGTVNTVQHGPRYLMRQHWEHIVHPERHFQCIPKIKP